MPATLMLKRIGYAGIIIVALALAVVLIGYALPQDHVASVSGVSTRAADMAGACGW